jgi:hypothetical protein
MLPRMLLKVISVLSLLAIDIFSEYLLLTFIVSHVSLLTIHAISVVTLVALSVCAWFSELVDIKHGKEVH